MVWEAAPYSLRFDKALRQRWGFHRRAQTAIHWHAIDLAKLDDAGIFGMAKKTLIENEVAFTAQSDSEDLFLTQALWFGWPDPPEWGLISRARHTNGAPWRHWGNFSDVPKAWIVPGLSGAGQLK